MSVMANGNPSNSKASQNHEQAAPDGEHVGIGVFFGEYRIRNWAATRRLADEYAAFAQQHLPGLSVGIRPLPSGAALAEFEPLPARHWWPVVPV